MVLLVIAAAAEGMNEGGPRMAEKSIRTKTNTN
jgi:hypothetical protein